ncbi:hypothetical protein EDC01DRAFT_369838 [Geopyxis carbonaria]|nr:hypothetical protein EDC01DRAFT_369838 [Geopyxis carbonaria]
METTPPFTGKLALITGASRGPSRGPPPSPSVPPRIGAAIALNFARKGANLLLTSSASSASETSAVAAQVLAINPAAKVHCVQADIGSLDGTGVIIDAARAHFGGDALRIDILIHNAGVSGNQFLQDVEVEEFDRQYRINVRGPLLLMQLAAPYLPTDRSGRIVNMSSVSSTLGFMAQSVYGGTKAALDAMTRTWARELSERATVNAVNPGPVETRMYSGTSGFFQDNLKPFIQSTPGMQLTPAEREAGGEEMLRAVEAAGGRCGRPEEVAGVVAMLCSPEAGWCTGQVVCANGGMIFGTN